MMRTSRFSSEWKASRWGYLVAAALAVIAFLVISLVSKHPQGRWRGPLQDSRLEVEQLASRVRDRLKANQGHLSLDGLDHLMVDSYGRDIEIRIGLTRITIRGCGPDGLLDTDDDAVQVVDRQAPYDSGSPR